MLDVIQTRDGNVFKGVIVEQVPGRYYRIALPGGSTFNVPANSVTRITREPNDSYARGATATPEQAPPAFGSGAPGFYPSTEPGVRPTAISTGPSLPPPAVVPGWRFEGQSTINFPTSDLSAFSTGFGARVRFGYEYLFGNFGIQPSFALQTARFGSNSDDSVFYFGVQPSVKAQLHLGLVAPFAELGLGFDIFRASLSDGFETVSDSASGLGLDLAIGVEFVFSRNVSAGLSWQIHPGFTKYGDSNLAFMGMVFGVTYLM